MAERADNSPKWIAKRAAKAMVAGALCSAGARWVVNAVARARAGGGRVLVLSYHRATSDFAVDARDSLPSLLVSAETLRRQIEQVAREREIVTLAEARRRLASPPPRPGRRERDAVALTFDDGYVGCHDHALPVLASLKAPATVFVATGYVGTERRLTHDRLHASLSELRRRGLAAEQAGLPRPQQTLLDLCASHGPAATLDRLISRLPQDELVSVAEALERRLRLDPRDLPRGTRILTWEEARELAANGVEIGGHTVNHAVLANLPPSRARLEVSGCFDEIARHLGAPPRHFAYPNGYHTPAVRRMVAECGFEGAVTTEDRENRRGGDPYALCRKVVWENTTLGAVGYSRALAACNLDGVFGALGLQRAVPGERPNATDEGAPAKEPEEPERAAV